MRKTIVTSRTAKPVKKMKSAADKLATKLSKLDEVPDYVKVSTPDFLDLLASNLETGEGVGYASEHGTLTVRPRSPKELLNTVRYLRRQATKLVKD